jgi:hypothetical protein
MGLGAGTPEGYYEATPGAEDVLKWVTNHGPESAATVLPVSAIAKLHRPEALPDVLDQLETAHALGVDDISQVRFDVQAKTGSAKPPGGMLHILAIGVDTFGDKAGGLHLDFAAEDAHDVASALFESQKGSPGKTSLYADVSSTYLPNDKASKTAIEDALDSLAQNMAKNESGQDTAVILVSSHGELIDGQFYFVPYGFRQRIAERGDGQRRLGERVREESWGARQVWEGSAAARRLPFRGGRRWRLGERPRRQSPAGRHGHGKRHCADVVQEERTV